MLKQQGHFHDINALAFSSDGQVVTTAGDDGKVKLWNTTSGFCFVTFTDHTAPVTSLQMSPKNNAVISASLDGTIRAYDLVRYRNFRIMTTPTAVQLSAVAVDVGGEIVAAGAMDPFEIYVFSMQTGRLLDILTGHEGPISCLAFHPISVFR